MTTLGYLQLGGEATQIRIVRPSRAICTLPQDARGLLIPPILDADILSFSRAEWSIMVLSGLFTALGPPNGWNLWDEATAHRAPHVSEKDHLLVVASMFTQGVDPGTTFQACHPGHDRATAAFQELARRAGRWREQEGIATPITVFPDGSAELPESVSPMLEHAVEKTHIETLLDLAKHGDEAIFKDLAQTLGVPAEKLDELWAGTIRRVQ